MSNVKFYLVLDQMNGWGAGETREAAIEEAGQWLCDEDGRQGISAEQVDEMIVSEHESRNGADGVFIYEVTDFDWPEDADYLDGDQWYKFYWQQEEASA